MASQPPESITSPVQPGNVLAGKYRVERVLGAGGMGVVVQATHLDLDERVALKFLLPEALRVPEATARFVREARAAVKIKSEHVARVIDVGRLENDAPYMVMEFLEGSDLSALIERGPVPVEDAVDYVIQACDAIAEAHAAGIVHRDLKPSNLFLSRRTDGSSLIKVLDFGISKVAAADLSDAGLTQTSALLGSPYYMSPEQTRSPRGVDHRSDVWSLGVILYELLAGAPPFVGEALPDVLAAILREPPQPLRDKRPEVPEELEQVILRALVKERESRYQSVGELAAALAPFAPRRSRHLVERVFKLSGVHAPVPSSAPMVPSAGPMVTSLPGSSIALSQEAPAPNLAPEPNAPPTALSSQAPAVEPARAGASTHQTFTQTATTAKKKAMALGAGLGLGFLAVAGIAAISLRSTPPPSAVPLSSSTATTLVSSPPPPLVPPTAPEVTPVAPVVTPSGVASAPPPEATPAAPEVLSAEPVTSAKVPENAPKKPASKPVPAPKPSAKPEPAETVAPKKNPLSIDLK